MHVLVSLGGRRGSPATARSMPPDVQPVRPAAADAVRREHLVPRWWAEIGLLVGLYLAYVLTRGLQSSSAADADRTGWALLRWEERWHLAFEMSLNRGLQELPALAVLSGYFYATLHFVVTPAVLVFLYRRHPAGYRQARTALGLATAIALIGYFTLPTAPPRLLVGGGFQDTMAAVSAWGWWGGAGSAPRGLGGLTNQVAAMPSLHVGWALWSGWCIARYARRRSVRILGVAYPLVTTLVVIATANHYLVDAVAGAALVAFAWVVVSRYLTRQQPLVPLDVEPVDVIDLTDADPVSATSHGPAIPTPRSVEPAQRRCEPCGRSAR